MRSQFIARLGPALLVAVAAFSAGAQVQNGSFESQSVAGTNSFPGGTNYKYLLGTQSSWTYAFGTAGPPRASGAGLINTYTVVSLPAFNSFAATSGSQVAFVQGTGSSISQLISGLSIGSYTLTFNIAGRAASGAFDGDTDFGVFFGGNLIGSGSTTAFQPFTAQSFTFNTLATSGTLSFANQSVPGDHTFMLDDVALQANVSAVPEPATVALVATGLLALAGIARRRRTA